MTYDTITVRPNATGFGAEITGLDLSRPLTPDAQADVLAAWAAHSVLWFPDQPLSHDQLEQATQIFGAFGHDPFIKPVEGHPHILEVRREPEETGGGFGNAWHSDWSYQETPPAATLLHAKTVPPVGGDTVFADACAAYDSLSPKMQEMLSGLRALHSARRIFGEKGLYRTDYAPQHMEYVFTEETEEVNTHPIIRTHPVSGRKAIYVNAVYTVGIEGMDFEEAKPILKFLYARVIEPRFQYRHKWQPDMLIVWDNRSAQHFADGGYDGHRRVMHRTTVAGEAPV